MLDIKLIRDTPEVVRQDLTKRGDPEKQKLLEEVIAWDQEWRELTQEVNRLRQRRNEVSKEIAETKRAGGDAASLMEEAAKLPSQIRDAEVRLDQLRANRDGGLLSLPNVLHESVPIGKDDSENVEVRRWGEPPDFDFDPVAHGKLLEKLGMGDFERAAKVAGAGFVYLRGPLVLLDLALQRFAMHHLVQKGYVPVEPPYFLRRRPYEGVVDLEDFETVMYKVENEDYFLIATSEHPIAAMYMDEIIDEDDLPLRFAGISTNFRKEIGAHGVDTRGLFRMHQFNKVEQFIFSRPEESWDLHEELMENTEVLHQQLGLPYRVVNCCTGDVGTVAAKRYDLEAWFPRQGKYAEIVSNSNCTDYQARRLNIRAGKVGGEKFVPHTLNSTAIATSRTMVAILENFQNEDGTVTLPEALRPFMGGMERIEAG